MGFEGAFIVPHPPLIIPEVGRGEERKIQHTIDAYKKVAEIIAEIKPDTIIISSPHSINYYDYFHISPGKQASGDFKNFGASVALEVDYDYQLVEEIDNLAGKRSFPAGSKGSKQNNLDHGTMIPLYFINEVYQDYNAVRISLSGLSLENHYEFGKLIHEAIKDKEKKYVFVASGDLSHKLKESGPYGFAKEGPVFDKKLISAVENNNLKAFLNFDDKFLNKAAECGLRSFVIMAGAIEEYDFKANLLAYEGPFGVGYAVASFLPKD
ncbi:MAG: AmmeMemoRadiSam system protein B [Candidatus Izimaplasma sp.]|nr:AmmeMemoRadiSam system protein B [Candidatus Izimaplasma bacterium]